MVIFAVFAYLIDIVFGSEHIFYQIFNDDWKY